MANLSLPTKNQFAFTYTITPAGDEMISIGHNFFTKKGGNTAWTHESLSDYFAGQTLKTDAEKHDGVSFPIDTIDRHFFTNQGVEVVVANGLLYYRAYPSENTWHVTDHLSTSPLLHFSTSPATKRLLIHPIAHVALEGNTMFVDSGDIGFDFTLEDAPATSQTFRCKSCHESFTTMEYPNATIICSHCSCAEATRVT